MKKLLMILLFMPTIAFGQLGDYYYSNGHPKAKGLNFQIKPPLGFEQLEADRPNIVQKWIKNKKDNDTMVIFMALVENLSGEFKGISKEQWKQILQSEDMIAGFVAQFDNAENGKYIVVDDYPGVMFDVPQRIERLDFSMEAHMKIAQVFVGDRLFSVQMLALHKDLIKANTLLFYLVANSIVFPDQYGN